jgi:type II secretory pathway pseudopilin PulG
MVSHPVRQRGVTYLALLLAVVLTSGVLATGATAWAQLQRREREKQLLWAGDQIRRAIAGYAQAGAPGGPQYPATLQDLLLDPRSPARRRFLRQIYDDPMTVGTDWGLVRNPQGRIVGVYSRSTAKPVKTARFPPAYAQFEKAASYTDWRFMAQAPPGATADRP